MKTLLLAAAFLTLATLAPRAKSQGGFDSAYTTLYQPNDILTDRLSDVGALAAYMKQLTAVCNEFFADETKPDSLDIVVAIKPRERSRVWFVSATRAPGDAQLESLRSKLE